MNACFGISEAENEELLLQVMALARAQGQCKESRVAAGNIQDISSNVMEAVKDLKRQVAAAPTPSYRPGGISVSLRNKVGLWGPSISAGFAVLLRSCVSIAYAFGY